MLLVCLLFFPQLDTADKFLIRRKQGVSKTCPAVSPSTLPHIGMQEEKARRANEIPHTNTFALAGQLRRLTRRCFIQRLKTVV